MRTNADSAGRIVAPTDVAVESEDGLPVVHPVDDLPPLTDELIRDTLGSTRSEQPPSVTPR